MSDKILSREDSMAGGTSGKADDGSSGEGNLG